MDQQNKIVTRLRFKAIKLWDEDVDGQKKDSRNGPKNQYLTGNQKYFKEIENEADKKVEKWLRSGRVGAGPAVTAPDSNWTLLKLANGFHT